MAFKVSADAQTIFFTKVFGSNHPVVAKVKALVSHGITFEVDLYTVTAKSKTTIPTMVKLTIGTSALMKGLATPPVYTQNAKLISEWVQKLFQDNGSPLDITNKPIPVVDVTVTVGLAPNGLPNLIQLIKAIRTVTGLGLYEAKLLGEKVQNGELINLAVVGMTGVAAQKTLNAVNGINSAMTVAPYLANVQKAAEAAAESFAGVGEAAKVLGAAMKAMPVPAVIKLKDAKALGQQVHGTSSGSVYYCIAYTDHVKVAARLYKSGSISIRAEWDGQPDKVKEELKKLEEGGIQMKSSQGYGSIHFDATDVPLQRVIGAFLVGTGINWKAAVMNGAELVIAEKAS